MSDRYTRKDAEKALDRLANACGRTVGYGPGEWHLDYNAIYGGCAVREMMPTGSGERDPFGSMRRSPRDFCDAVRFALDALSVAGRQPR